MEKRMQNKTLLGLLVLLTVGLGACQKESVNEPLEMGPTVKYLDESDPSKIWDLTATRPYEFIGEPMQQWVLDELEKDAQKRQQHAGRFGCPLLKKLDRFGANQFQNEQGIKKRGFYRFGIRQFPPNR